MIKENQCWLLIGDGTYASLDRQIAALKIPCRWIFPESSQLTIPVCWWGESLLTTSRLGREMVRGSQEVEPVQPTTTSRSYLLLLGCTVGCHLQNSSIDNWLIIHKNYYLCKWTHKLSSRKCEQFLAMPMNSGNDPELQQLGLYWSPAANTSSSLLLEI